MEVHEAHTTAITIDAPEVRVIDDKLREIMRMRYLEAIKLANQYSGKVLRKEEFSDGFFLEVVFKEKSMLNYWMTTVGVKE